MNGKRWSRKATAALVLLAAAAAAAVLFVPTRHKPVTFLGKAGYRFSLAGDTARSHTLSSAFLDESKRSEAVFIHPAGLGTKEVFNTPESEYAERGIVRLEVRPNDAYPKEARGRLVEAFRFAAARTLEKQKKPHQFATLEGAPLPGFALEIGGPTPVTQVFMQGARYHYLLTAPKGNMVLHEVLSSLVDAPMQEDAQP